MVKMHVNVCCFLKTAVQAHSLVDHTLFKRTTMPFHGCMHLADIQSRDRWLPRIGHLGRQNTSNWGSHGGFFDGFLSIAEVKVEQKLPGLGISPMLLAAGSVSRLLLTEDCFWLQSLPS